MKEHFISVVDTIEPQRVYTHIISIEWEEEEFEIHIKETMHDLYNSSFHFDDISDALWVTSEIGFKSSDDLLDVCIKEIYKNME